MTAAHLLLSLFARGAAMRSDDGAVDHLQHVQCAAAVSQRLKQKVPDARLAPATELLPHGVPFAERRRQVTPRRSGPADPEYAVQPMSMILGWTPATQGGGGQEGREHRPLFVRHQSADHSQPRVCQEAGQDWPQVGQLNLLTQKGNGTNPGTGAGILFGIRRGAL